MARREQRPSATREEVLTPQRETCSSCGKLLCVAYHNSRTVSTLHGLCHLRVVIRRCCNPACERYHIAYHPEEEGIWALPHAEFGLEIIALVGLLRYGEHRSVPEIHQHLRLRGLQISERTVTHLVERYEELVALHLWDDTRLQERLKEQGQVIVAIDGLQPDVGHEVLWVVRDCLSGEILLARALLSSTHGDLAALLEEAKDALPVPITAVLSDGELSIRQAVQQALPGVAHQLCQFHYLREAAEPIFEADRHAKKELKKQVRGIRPIERALEGRSDKEATAMRGYALAVRSALTDDGRPPLCASGLRLYQRLDLISTSISRLEAKRGAFLQS
jgi:hypothetical protein